jgi:putative ABC transport system substrate-binding protein
MRRREFFRLFAAGTMVAWPLSARAQNAPSDGPQRRKIPLVGIFSPSIAIVRMARSPPMKSFLEGLHDLGYEEGTNIAIEFRSAEGNWGRLPNIAVELVNLNVDVLIPKVCGAPLKAAMQATSTIPIVVGACNDDLVEAGIISSLAHPGGNVTGLSKLTPELTAKRLELLKELLPNASRVAVLWDSGYSAFLSDWQELQARARALKVTLESVEVRNLADLDRAFTAIAREQIDAVITFSNTMTYNSPTRVAGLAPKLGSR